MTTDMFQMSLPYLYPLHLMWHTGLYLSPGVTYWVILIAGSDLLGYTYRRVCNISNTTGSTFVYADRVAQSLVFYVVYSSLQLLIYPVDNIQKRKVIMSAVDNCSSV